MSGEVKTVRYYDIITAQGTLISGKIKESKLYYLCVVTI